jgi:hypothetical protein
MPRLCEAFGRLPVEERDEIQRMFRMMTPRSVERRHIRW